MPCHEILDTLQITVLAVNLNCTNTGPHFVYWYFSSYSSTTSAGYSVISQQTIQSIYNLCYASLPKQCPCQLVRLHIRVHIHWSVHLINRVLQRPSRRFPLNNHMLVNCQFVQQYITCSFDRIVYICCHEVQH